MKKFAIGFCLTVLCFAGITAARAARADEKSPNPEDIWKALGMSVYLQGGYTYNGNAGTVNGQQEENDLRVFDHKANSFTLDLAEIVFAKEPAEGRVGYKVKFSAGETAKWIHSRGLSGVALDQPQAGEGTDSFDVTEAYVSYNAPIGRGLRFDFGKMVTFLGAELIEAIDNPNYSRSFLFNYAIAFTHTGLKASYTFTDAINAGLYVVNGWDNSTDNNRGKSYGATIGFAPAEAFSLLVNGITGPEEDNNSRSRRNLVDIVATIKPVKPLSIILNYDNGKEDDVPAGLLPSGIPADAEWSGISGIVKYDFTEKYSIAVRGEYFDDKDGFRTGIAQKLKEVTVTPEIRLDGGLVVRPEYRHDMSDQQAFDNGTKKSQDTIALGVMYRW